MDALANLSLPFSSSRTLSRRALEKSMPSYLAFTLYSVASETPCLRAKSAVFAPRFVLAQDRTPMICCRSLGAEDSSNIIRERLRCAVCGHRGAVLQHPSWIDAQIGEQPFPVDLVHRLDVAPEPGEGDRGRIV